MDLMVLLDLTVLTDLNVPPVLTVAHQALIALHMDLLNNIVITEQTSLMHLAINLAMHLKRDQDPTAVATSHLINILTLIKDMDIKEVTIKDKAKARDIVRLLLMELNTIPFTLKDLKVLMESKV